jgi:sucrose-6-phosphate hydrolase SacC (GH32 family)
VIASRFSCSIACLFAGISWQSLLAEPPAAVPAELVNFKPHAENPVFEAGRPGDWDAAIRERGWILKDKGSYHLWYTGYDGTAEGTRQLGYATSADGIHWKRHPNNPIHREHWVEDMMVIKHEGTYHMFAEGKDDQAQLLTSQDGIRWTRQGILDVRTTNGKLIEPGPYGTPTAYFENGIWHLFYERSDSGVWLATSKDMKVWTNVQDAPVLSLGPGENDSRMIALNQIIKHQGRYYAYYHGSGSADKPRLCSPAIATSTDLIRWTKYPKNPLRAPVENRSSGIVVPEGNRFRFYTMHGKVDLFLPASPQ